MQKSRENRVKIAGKSRENRVKIASKSRQKRVKNARKARYLIKRLTKASDIHTSTL